MYNFPREIDDAWAVHEVFRRLGFLPEEIFVSMDNPDGLLLVVLMAQEKTFCVSVGKPPFSEAEFIALWTQFTTALPSIPEEYLQQAWERSIDKFPALVQALFLKGFKINNFKEQRDTNKN